MVKRRRMMKPRKKNNNYETKKTWKDNYVTNNIIYDAFFHFPPCTFGTGTLGYWLGPEQKGLQALRRWARDWQWAFGMDERKLPEFSGKIAIGRRTSFSPYFLFLFFSSPSHHSSSSSCCLASSKLVAQNAKLGEVLAACAITVGVKEPGDPEPTMTQALVIPMKQIFVLLRFRIWDFLGSVWSEVTKQHHWRYWLRILALTATEWTEYVHGKGFQGRCCLRLRASRRSRPRWSRGPGFPWKNSILRTARKITWFVFLLLCWLHPWTSMKRSQTVWWFWSTSKLFSCSSRLCRVLRRGAPPQPIWQTKHSLNVSWTVSAMGP